MADNKAKARIAEELKTAGNNALNTNVEEAIRLYGEAIKLDPSNHVLYSNRSAAYLKNNDGENALADAEKAIQINPSWARGYGRKGAALYVLEKYDECISTYEKALELEPANENTKTALEDAKTAKAQALRAQQAEANQMFNSFAQFFQGDVSAKARSHPETAAFANDPTFLANVKKIQANPNSILQLLGDKQIMAFVTAMLQTDQGAAGAFAREMEEEPAPTQEPPKQEAPPQEAPKKAAEPEKKVPELTEEQKAAADLKEKGNAAYKAKKFTEALDFYNQAQQVDPENMVYLNNKAAVYFEMEKYEECIKECEAAVELGRTRRADFKLIARAFARTGNAYAKLNNFDEAIKFYNKSLTEHRDAATLKSLRDVEKLKEDREKAAYLSPELSDKAREEGNTHFKAQEWPQAIKSYSEAIKRDPSKAVNYSNRAAAYTKLGELRLAVKDCDEAIKLDSKFIKAYLRKGHAQFVMKEYSNALETYDQASKIDPTNDEARDGIAKTIAAVQGSQGGESEEEILKRASQDPEIREILSDPVMKQILQDMQTDPKAAAHHLENAEVRRRILKLRAAGLLG